MFYVQEVKNYKLRMGKKKFLSFSIQFGVEKKNMFLGMVCFLRIFLMVCDKRINIEELVLNILQMGYQ